MTGSTRVRVKYSKDYPATLIGHLDTMSMLQRAMRMCGWPLAFTQGFSPRVKLSSGPPLSLGFSSDSEYLDVTLRHGLSGYRKDLLAEKVIKGVRIKRVDDIPEDDPGINGLILGFRYRADCEIVPENGESGGYRVFKENGETFIDVRKKDGNIPNPAKVTGRQGERFRKVKTFIEVSEGEICD